MKGNPKRRIKLKFAASSSNNVSSAPWLLNLPSEISVSIFSKLTLNSIGNCRCVCNQWRRFLSGPDFIKLHLINNTMNPKIVLRSRFLSTYSVDHEPSEGNSTVTSLNFPLETFQLFRIYGSSNGLLFVSIDDQCVEGNIVKGKTMLWNPLTGDYRLLPDANPIIQTNIGTGTCIAFFDLIGFGYDSFYDDYKVVHRISHHSTYQTDVYSLKTNSWKVITSIKQRRFGFPVDSVGIDSVGIDIEGTIYWLLLGKGILGFDLKDEKFLEVELPPNPLGKYRSCNLTVIGGCLGLCCSGSNDQNSEKLVFWMMKGEENKAECWIKVITIPCGVIPNTRNWHFRSIWLSENWRKAVCFNRDAEVNDKSAELLVYDSQVKSIVETIPLLSVDEFPDVVMYGETLVSPNNAW